MNFASLAAFLICFLFKFHFPERLIKTVRFLLIDQVQLWTHTHRPIYLPSYLPIYLPTYLPIYLSIYLSICLSIYLPTYLFIYLLSIYGSTVLLLYLCRSFSFLILYTESVGLLGLGISPSQGLYLHIEQHKQNKRTKTSMPRVGFEPTSPVFERAKTVHALDGAATMKT
jgi:hypothetical protein